MISHTATHTHQNLTQGGSGEKGKRMVKALRSIVGIKYFMCFPCRKLPADWKLRVQQYECDIQLLNLCEKLEMFEPEKIALMKK